MHSMHNKLQNDHSGPPGLKGHKGDMGRYGKMGPPGFKGNFEFKLPLQLDRFV